MGSKESKKIIFRLITIFLVIIICLVVGLALFFFNPVARFSNDYKLTKLKHEVLEKQYPNSKLAMEESHMGLLLGNSNHCDFLIQAIYITNDDFAQVQKYYDNISLNSIEKSEIRPSKEIINLSATLLPQEKSRFSEFNESKINSILFNNGYDSGFQYYKNKTIYLVNVFEQFFEGLGMWDIRCH